MDKIYNVYSDIFEEEFKFMSIDEVSNLSSQTLTGSYDSNFSFVFKSSDKYILHRRRVYTILDCVYQMGGLYFGLVLLMRPLLSCFNPAVRASTLLSGGFIYDYPDKNTFR